MPDKWPEGSREIAQALLLSAQDASFVLFEHRATALPALGSEDDLNRMVGRVLSQPLDRDRPLWEM